MANGRLATWFCGSASGRQIPPAGVGAPTSGGDKDGCVATNDPLRRQFVLHFVLL